MKKTEPNGVSGCVWHGLRNFPTNQTAELENYLLILFMKLECTMRDGRISNTYQPHFTLHCFGQRIHYTHNSRCSGSCQFGDALFAELSILTFDYADATLNTHACPIRRCRPIWCIILLRVRARRAFISRPAPASRWLRAQSEDAMHRCGV